MISYAPFWKTLSSKGITQYQLIHEYNFSTGTLDTLRKNNSITLNTLQDICKMLECDIDDVVEFIEEKK
ncbi:MAG: helix-turn-helix transcriptional regulator [Lachnospiraceae bacterium]|nr:helix-turn-helix transcriptional regulator [Lachnospiraceae bacterium]MDD3615792.1 helix-turn-helix transcriptional regulator [Lachnospiraceae bacterium]